MSEKNLDEGDEEVAVDKHGVKRSKRTGQLLPGTKPVKTTGTKLRNQTIRRQIQRHAKDLVADQIAAAREGDLDAGRYLINKILPSLRPVACPANLDVDRNATLSEYGMAVLAAAAKGDLPSDVANQLMNSLGLAAKIKEVDELGARLDQLEKRIEPGSEELNIERDTAATQTA